MEIEVPSLVRIKPDALYKTGKYLRQSSWTEVAVLYGESIKEMTGAILDISFASSEIKIVYEMVVTSSSIDNAFETVKSIPRNTKALFAIGGGKAIDYAKYCAHVLQLPLVSVPTVISNDGFCSPLSSLEINDKKTTVKTKIPEAVIVDTKVISKAPEKFIYSGMGDLFCKLSALFDWKLSYKKTGEHVNDFAAVICKNSVEAFLHYHTKDITDTGYLGIVVSSLMMSGIAMEIAGSSRPASGSEHLISHAYDKYATTPSMHGLQTGVASYMVSHVQGPHFEDIKKVIETTGFLEFMSKHPLNREDLKTAVLHAHEIKEGFYTILSEKGAIDKILYFIDNDPYMLKMTL